MDVESEALGLGQLSQETQKAMEEAQRTISERSGEISRFREWLSVFLY